QTGFFVVQSNLKICPNPTPASFANLPAGISANYDFIIITHKSLSAGANEYLAYRNTKYNAKIYYIDEIMNEFAFGDFTPLALKRMGKYMTNMWNPLPSQKRRHILLLGKCIALAGNTGNNLVPTWGNPVSDNLFIGNFDNNQIMTNDRLTIGRVTALNNAEVLAYLDKVKAFEQKGAQPYIKNALHLGGGANKWEIDTISHILKNIMGKIIEGYPYGADVFTHTKDFTKPIVGDIMSTIFNKINNGVGVINFLGHGTTQNWDVAIDDVTKYENKDRYPFIISNGCQTGDFALPGSSIGENFVKTPEKGAVVYLGGSATTWLSVVDRYVDTLYVKLFKDTSNVPIGDAVQNTLKNYTNVPAPYLPAFRNHARYVCLQGDPSLKLELPYKPDFTIQPSDITILPKQVSLQADSFMVQAVIRNNARAYKDSIQYRISVNSKVVYQKAYTGKLYNRDTLRVWISQKAVELTENNTICITLDYQNYISEVDEDNNTACKSFYLPKNKAIAMYPIKYQIVSTPTVKLIASAENMHTQPNTTFTFQIDTVATFNSGFLKTYTDIPAKNYQAELTLPFTLTDSTAYYWRVKINSGSAQDYWATSNFTYISNSPSGIAQVHLQQYNDGKKYLLDINQTEKLWTFSQNTATIDINTSTGYSINGAVGLDVNCCCIGANTGLFIAVMHPTSLKAWESPFGGFDCGENGGFYFNSPAYCFNQNGKNKIPAFINSIPDGYIVFAWKASTANIILSTFSEQIYQAFESIGSAHIRSFQDNESFIIFGKKGASIGSAIEKGYDPSSPIPIHAQNAFLRVVYNTFWYEGKYEYERIGPASSWSSLHWNTNTTRIDPTGDTITYDIYGVRIDGTRSLLKSKVRTYQNTNLSDINANTYPYLDIVAHFKDTLFNTAPQLRHNLVFYTGVGDLTLDPVTFQSNLNDTISYKANIQAKIYVRNISPHPVDSVWVHYYLSNAYSNEKVLLKTEKIRSLHALSDSLMLSLNTTLSGNLQGWYDVVIEVNPYKNPLEQYYHNNTYKKRIYLKDDTPPQIKITFDGQEIADKQEVSPTVRIDATLQDNSTRFYLSDTTYFEEITLTYPNNEQKPVYFNTANSLKATFSPGSAANSNTASIQILHDSLPDGYYALTIKAKDYEHNTVSKTVNFAVFKQESGITQIFAFPNPFTDKIKFSFTVQGPILPDEVFVDIFDLMGRRVHRIFFTNIKHGENISEFAWEGTDEKQAQLSSGVYLYKMTAKHQGKEMKVVVSDKDQFFNRKGYGKIIFIK
ncbi:MAG: C25 family cysteine peptidase, partial [Bacteroidia bacterium]|nr:C25 family cysteine peptidase [Bacteroidia bacterium]